MDFFVTGIRNLPSPLPCPSIGDFWNRNSNLGRDCCFSLLTGDLMWFKEAETRWIKCQYSSLYEGFSSYESSVLSRTQPVGAETGIQNCPFPREFPSPTWRTISLLASSECPFFFFLDFMPVDLVYNFKAFASNLQIIELHWQKSL